MQARNRNLLGDYEGAMKSARSAKDIAIWSIIIGFMIAVVVIVVRVQK